MMRSEDIRDRLKEMEEFLLKEYKDRKIENKRDWQTYEQQLMKRIKGVICNLEPLIDQSVNIEILRGPGRLPELELKQRVIILLLKTTIRRKQQNDGFNAWFIFSPFKN